MAVTAVLIFIVVYGLEHYAFDDRTSKRRRALTTFLVLFIVIFALNLVWPYGGGPAD
jgi:hypothetical protein